MTPNSYQRIKNVKIRSNYFANMSQLFLSTIILVLCAGENNPTPSELPSWITNNPSFQRPTQTNSVETGNGSISANAAGNQGWLVSLNQKKGHGIELEVKKLSLNPNSNDFLLISSWPLTGNFKRIKLYTGNFEKPLKILRIPNTKTFFVLYSASQATAKPEMHIIYRRYGISLEANNFPTENPAKKKETIHEIQLKGKAPEEYVDADFMNKVKEGIRAAAKRYCTAHNITFNENIPLSEMVLIHRVGFCPFEWPDRNICVSIKHSVYVSGVRVPDEQIILNYQLVSDHLQKMWSEDAFPELQEIGVTVFQLPPTYSVVSYWIVILALTIICTLIIGYISWKANRTIDIRDDAIPFEQVRKVKKPKLNLAKHQKIPSFIYKDPSEIELNKFKDPVLKSGNDPENVFKPGDSSGLPIKNYFGSILFGGNRAFEDDEDKPAETQTKSTSF